MAVLYSRGMESYGYFIADVSDLGSVSVEFMECSYNGGFACDEGFYIGRLLLHGPRTACTYLEKPSAQPRA